MTKRVYPKRNSPSNLGSASHAISSRLAGILEGEATFHPPNVNGAIHIHMTDRDVIERVAAIAGTPVSKRPRKNKNPKWQDTWQTNITGTKGREIMEAVLPYMGERRAKRIIESLTKTNWGFPDSTRRPLLALAGIETRFPRKAAFFESR